MVKSRTTSVDPWSAGRSVQRSGSELITTLHPVVPVPNHLFGRRIRSPWFQLRERHRQSAATPKHSNKHFRFTLRFASHSRDIHIFADSQRRDLALGFAASFKGKFQPLLQDNKTNPSPAPRSCTYRRRPPFQSVARGLCFPSDEPSSHLIGLIRSFV